MKKIIVIILMLMSTASFAQTRYGHRAGRTVGHPVAYHAPKRSSHNNFHHGKHPHAAHGHARRRF